MQYSIDASQDWYAQTQNPSEVADSIVQNYTSSIDHFISAGRQQNHISELPQARHQASFPGLRIDQLFNQGMETIRITVYPQFNNPGGSQPVLDLNMDGYVVWIHHWFVQTRNGVPVGVNSIPYDLLINGTVVVNAYLPPDKFLQLDPITGLIEATIMIVIAFGPTALRCQSLHDKVNAFNNPAHPEYGGMAAQISPSRPDIKATPGYFGKNIPSHKDILGYFFWGPNTTPTNPTGWGDQFNPDSYAYDPGVEGQYDQAYSPPNIVQIIQFADAQNSPLKATGTNIFTVRPNAAGLVAGGAQLRTLTIAADQAQVALDQAGVNNYPTDSQKEINDLNAAYTAYPVSYINALITAAQNAHNQAPPDYFGAWLAQRTNNVNIQAAIVQAFGDNSAYLAAAAAAYAQGHTSLGDEDTAIAAQALAAYYLLGGTTPPGKPPPSNTALYDSNAATADALNASNLTADQAQLTADLAVTTAQWQADAATIGLQEAQRETLAAEFYNRNQIRVASRSWNYPGGVEGSIILVNDKPLYYTGQIDPSVSSNLNFDLTSLKDPPNAATFGEVYVTPATTDKNPVVPGKPIGTWSYRIIQVSGNNDTLKIGPYSQ